ncbi:MAG TPA: YceI family protein [Acidimicrobiia bacterium]|nr:YceI family protein [Acidimicrobiia bacterium]
MDRRRRGLVFVGGGMAVAAIAVFAVWWFLLRSDAPPAVSLDQAVGAATSTTRAGTPDTTAIDGDPATTTTTEPTATTDAGADTTAAPDTAGTSVTGTWTSGDDSFLGYRVEEELAGIGLTTAAGRTSDVAGTLVVDGATVVSVTIEANLQTLRSDSSRRDGALRRQALETDAFPTATFVLTRPIDLPAGATNGDPFTIDATGELTLHGVTREITIPIAAQLVGDVIAVVGSTEIVFADYDIDRPSAAVVLSVEDVGIMEFQLLFSR